jgi:predicted CoA-binding protein
MSQTSSQESALIKRVLKLNNVAIVGMSDKAHRDSHMVGRYLHEHGYRIFPVNPRCERILDIRCYPTLEDIPQQVDMVNVFRVPEAVPEIARDALAISATCLWLQLGVISHKGMRIAQRGGMDVVMDRCIKVEHERYLERALAWPQAPLQQEPSRQGKG